MQLADDDDEDDEVIAIDAEPQDYFVYYGWVEGVYVPDDVTHVRIHSSVRWIEYQHESNEGVFEDRRQLRIVILNDELNEIGVDAFRCTSIEEIVIPNAVRAIHERAFSCCSELTTVTLGDGLEEIGKCSFAWCTSLNEILIPNAVKTIETYAFAHCSGLTTVTLGDGLEYIRAFVFYKCTALEGIVIPRTVKEIYQKAFRRCSSLTNVEFCAEIEAFVSCEAMRDWWNRGVHYRCLGTYTFLRKHDIPNRMGLVRVQSWQNNIYEMLRCIPTAHTDDMCTLFHIIQSRLSLYESLKDSPALLELAIWKSKIKEHHGQSNVHFLSNIQKKRRTNSVSRTQCRTDSLATVMIIVPLVFSFLTDDSGGNNLLPPYIDDYYDDYDHYDDDDDRSGEPDWR